MYRLKKNKAVIIKVFLTFIIGVAVIMSSLVYIKKRSNVSSLANVQHLFKKNYNFVFIINESYSESKYDELREYLKDYNGSMINSIIIMSIKLNDKKISLYRLPIILQYYDEEAGYSDELKYYYCNNSDEKKIKLFIENIIKSNVDSMYKINANSFKNLNKLKLNLETNLEENVWTIDNKKYIISKNDYENVNKEEVENIFTKIIENYSNLNKNQRYNLIASIVNSSYSDISLKKVNDVLNKICDESNLSTYEIKVENIKFEAKTISEIIKNIDNKYGDIQLVYYDENFDLNKNYFISMLNKKNKLENKNEETTITTKNSDNVSNEHKTNTINQNKKLKESQKKSTSKQINTTKDQQIQNNSSGSNETSNTDENKNDNSTDENKVNEQQSSEINKETEDKSTADNSSDNNTGENKVDEQQNSQTEPMNNSVQEGSQQP